MKNQVVFFLSTLTLAGAAGYGCGSDADPTGSTGAGGSASSSGNGGSTQEGAVSSSSVGGAGGGVTAVSSSSSGSGSGTGGGAGSDAVLAVRKFFYGDTNFDGTANKVNGWKQYGFNLDGKVSTGASADLCKPQGSGAPSSLFVDGNGGIDNAFGKNILPLLLSLSLNLTTKANQSVAAGHYTLMFDLEGIGAMASQAPLVSKVYSGTPLSLAPKFDGSDLWPVAPEGLTNSADITSAKPVFPMSSVVANHWDSGPTGATVQLQINVEGFDIYLDLLGARVAMDLDPSHQNAQTGQLGGVIATTQLVTEMKRLMGAVEPSLCSGATADSVVAQIQQASDILLNGTQDPSKTCDGVSIGLGFVGSAVSLGGIGPVAPPPQQPCAP